jgi:hypothetical protein
MKITTIAGDMDGFNVRLDSASVPITVIKVASQTTDDAMEYWIARMDTMNHTVIVRQTPSFIATTVCVYPSRSGVTDGTIVRTEVTNRSTVLRNVDGITLNV